MSGHAPDPTDDSPLDDVFDALGHPTRRRLLATLEERGCGSPPAEPVDLSTFADRHGPDGRLELSHVHLPRLRDAGFVDWDRDAALVSRGPQFDGLRPFLAVLSERGRPPAEG
jgi:DNA-binding transcriptional ArsR family regulator